MNFLAQLLLLALCLSGLSAQTELIVPQNIVISAITANSFTFTYDVDPNADGYEYKLNQGQLKDAAQNTVVADLKSCTVYQLQIRSFKGPDYSNFSAPVKVITKADTANAPTSVSTSAGFNDSQITVIIEDEDRPRCTDWRYIVKVYQSTTVVSTTTSFGKKVIIGGLSSGTSYTVGVTLEGSVGSGLVSSETTSTAFNTSGSTVTLAAPTNLAVAIPKNTEAVITWSEVTGVDKYTLILDGEPYDNISTNSYHIKHLAPDSLHSVAVVAANAASKWGSISELLTIDTATKPETMVPLTNLVGASVSKMSSDGFIFSWEPAPEIQTVDGYEVMINENHKVIGPETSELYISCMESCKKFTMSVRSYRGAEATEYTEPLTMLSWPKVPAGVTSVTATPYSDGGMASLTIVDEHVKPECVDWEYSITVYDANNNPIKNVISKINLIIIDGLTPSTPYTFGVSVAIPRYGLKGDEVVSTQITTLAKTPVFANGPTNLRFVQEAGGDVNLTWDPLTGATKYFVKLNGEVYAADLTTETAKLSGLATCKIHYISIYAENAAMEFSPDSMPAEFYTGAGVPKAVNSVETRVIDGNNVEVIIGDPLDRKDCGKIQYEVTIGGIKIKDNSKRLLISGLTASTEYTAEVVVKDDATGLISETRKSGVFQTLPNKLARPNSPTITANAVTSCKRLEVLLAPGADVANADVASYVIKYTDPKGFIQSVTSKDTKVYLDIEPCTEYNLEAYTVSSDQVISAASSAVTSEVLSLATPVSGVHIKENGAAIDFTIFEPSTDPCNASDYVITLFEDGLAKEKIAEKTTTTVTGSFTETFVPGKSYYAVVRMKDTVTNLFGIPVKSNTIQYLNRAILPGAVAGLAAGQPTADSVDLSWTAATGATKYFVIYATKGFNPVLVEATTASITLTGLLSCMEYTVYVQAGDGTSVGPKSTPIEFVTLRQDTFLPAVSMRVEVISQTNVRYFIVDVERECETVDYEIITKQSGTVVSTFISQYRTGLINNLVGGQTYDFEVIAKDRYNHQKASTVVLGGSATMPTNQEYPAQYVYGTATVTLTAKDRFGTDHMWYKEYLNKYTPVYKDMSKKACYVIKRLARLGDYVTGSCSVTSIRQGSVLIDMNLEIVAGAVTQPADIKAQLISRIKEIGPATIKYINFLVKAADINVTRYTAP